jgi:hypothetical protein
MWYNVIFPRNCEITVAKFYKTIQKKGWETQIYFTHFSWCRTKERPVLLQYDMTREDKVRHLIFPRITWTMPLIWIIINSLWWLNNFLFWFQTLITILRTPMRKGLHKILVLSFDVFVQYVHQFWQYTPL